MNSAADERPTGDGTEEILRWQTSVPIFKNPVILRQLGIAVGIPFGLTALAVGLFGKGMDTLYALGLILAVLVAAWLLIMAVYRGEYDAEFVLDNKGVRCRTVSAQAKKNRAVGSLTVVLGLLSGKPAAAGAGVLAQSRQEVYIPWNGVTKVKYVSNHHTILLRVGLTESIALFCEPEHYVEVEHFVNNKLVYREKSV